MQEQSPLYNTEGSRTAIDNDSVESERTKVFKRTHPEHHNSEWDEEDFLNRRTDLQAQEGKRNFATIFDTAVKHDKRLKEIEKEYARRRYWKINTDDVKIPNYLLNSNDPTILERLNRLRERGEVDPKRFGAKPARRQGSPRSPVQKADIGELLSVESEELPDLFHQMVREIRASETQTMSPMQIIWDKYSGQHVYPKRLAEVFLKAGVPRKVVDMLAKTDIANRKPYKRD